MGKIIFSATILSLVIGLFTALTGVHVVGNFFLVAIYKMILVGGGCIIGALAWSDN